MDSGQQHTIPEHWLAANADEAERMEAAASEFILHCAKHAVLYFSISH